jgi:predicted RNase H-like HicB family nuclease
VVRRRGSSDDIRGGSIDGGMRMKRTFTAHVYREDAWYVAQCVDVDIASQGQTEREALDNLRDAVRLYFSEPNPGSLPAMRSIEVEVSAVAPPAIS